MKRGIYVICAVALILLTVYATNSFYPLRSYLIMYPLSKYYQKTGLFADIPLKIPSGKLENGQAFYPFTLYFNADNFSDFISSDQETMLSIIYYFGGFRFGKPYADYFDPERETYGAFYGAYAVNNNNLFFLDDMTLQTERIAAIPQFDQKYLVMPSIGLPSSDVVFEQEILDVRKSVIYIGHKNWHQIDAIIRTNTPFHRYTSSQLGYLQYGVPLDLHIQRENYRIEPMYARAYVRYFHEYKSTIVLYIIAKNKNITEQIDSLILSKSTLE